MTDKRNSGIVDITLQLNSEKALSELYKFSQKFKIVANSVEKDGKRIREALKGVQVPKVALPKAGSAAAGGTAAGGAIPGTKGNPLKGATKQVQNYGKAWKVAAGTLTSFLGVSAGLAGVVAVTRRVAAAGAEYSLRLAEIATLTDEASFSSQQQRDLIESVSNAYGETFLQTAPALYDAISAGATDAAEANELLDSAVKLSIGTISTQQQATSLLVGVLNAYGDEVEGAAEVTDDFFAIVRQGKLRLEELDPSLGRLTPLAKASGVSFKELGAALVALTRSGSSASEAITKIRSILNATTKKQQDFDEAFQRIGLRFDSTTLKSLGFIGTLQTLDRALEGNNEALGKTFGRVEALTGALSLVDDDARLFNEALEGMNSSAGRADQAFGELASSSGRKFKVLGNQISNFAAEAGDELVTATVKLAEFLDLLPDESLTGLEQVAGNALRAKREVTGLSAATEDLFKRLRDQGVLGELDLSDQGVVGFETAGGGEGMIQVLGLSNEAAAKLVGRAREVSNEVAEAAAEEFGKSAPRIEDRGPLEKYFATMSPVGMVASSMEGVTPATIAREFLDEKEFTERSVEVGRLAGEGLVDGYSQSLAAGGDLIALELEEGITGIVTRFTREDFAEGKNLVIPVILEVEEDLAAELQDAVNFAIATGEGVDAAAFEWSRRLAAGTVDGIEEGVQAAAEKLKSGERLAPLVAVDPETFALSIDAQPGAAGETLEVLAKQRAAEFENTKAVQDRLELRRQELQVRIAGLDAESDNAKLLQEELRYLEDVSRTVSEVLTLQRDTGQAVAISEEEYQKQLGTIRQIASVSEAVEVSAQNRGERLREQLITETKLGVLQTQRQEAELAADEAAAVAQREGSLAAELAAIDAAHKADLIGLQERLEAGKLLSGEYARHVALLEATRAAASLAAVDRQADRELALEQELGTLYAKRLTLLGEQEAAAASLANTTLSAQEAEIEKLLQGNSLSEKERDLLNQKLQVLRDIAGLQVEAAGDARTQKQLADLQKLISAEREVALLQSDQLALLGDEVAARKMVIQATLEAAVKEIDAKIAVGDLTAQEVALLEQKRALLIENAGLQLQEADKSGFMKGFEGAAGDLGEFGKIDELLGATFASTTAQWAASLDERGNAFESFKDTVIRGILDMVTQWLILSALQSALQGISNEFSGDGTETADAASDAAADQEQAATKTSQAATDTKGAAGGLASAGDTLGVNSLLLIVAGGLWQGVASNLSLAAKELAAAATLLLVANTVGSTSKFARGGVMKGEMLGHASLPVNAYASGGVADSPQLAIFGEGDGAEAFVPLPDGKRIPVALDISGLLGMQKAMTNLVRAVGMAHAPSNMGGEMSLNVNIDARGSQDPVATEEAVNRAIDKSMPRIADTLGSYMSSGRRARLVRGVRESSRGAR